MPSHMAAPHVHLNTYHHNNSLLFQFILNEFLLTYREVKTLHHLTAPLKASAKKANGDFNAIVQTIVQLSGPTHHYMRLFSWNIDAGMLGKLKNYCAFFSHNADYEDKTLLSMHNYADKAWILCLQSMETLRAIQAESKASAAQRAELYAMLDKLNLYMHRIARLIGQASLQFSDDENVIYYLLRHHKQLDALLGKGYTGKLLKKMYPKGVQEVGRFLMKRYTSRGFENLLPEISAKISELATALP